MMSFAAALLAGFLVEATVSWPMAVFRKIGHPVSWIGHLISKLEAFLNRPSHSPVRLRAYGAITVFLVLVACVSPAVAVSSVLPNGWSGVLIGGLLSWPFLATRSLYDHVQAIALPLARGQTDQARGAVSLIIGRNPETLDDKAIARASLESLAENSSDGVIAPLFWGLVFGLPGLVGYKVINTFDSMIGHRSARYVHFGMAAARLDDLANLIPSRITGGLFTVVSGRLRHAGKVMFRDANQHRSPNAGWPEAAMAAALDIRLSGPRVYGNMVANEPWLNGEAADPDAGSVSRGLGLYQRVMLVVALGLGLIALLERMTNA
jgi:adenosylcobinamide-phosphate synthase